MFVDFRTELVEGSSKRAGEELEQESTKKQKVDEDKDTTELQSLMEVIPDEEEVAIDIVPLATKEDLEDLYKLVKAKYQSTRPVEDLDLVLWNDLKTMFEPHIEDGIWKLQQRYPLTPPTITDMLNKNLQGRIVGIKSLLNAASIIAALIDVNAAQSKLVLLENFTENYSMCLRLLYKVNAAEGVNAASEEISTAELVSTAYGNPQIDLQDQGVIDSGCSRHMTGNMSYLTDYEDYRCREMNQFCEMKGILRQFSVARTPQQNGVAKRRNRTLIEAARTMLADSKSWPTIILGKKHLIEELANVQNRCVRSLANNHPISQNPKSLMMMVSKPSVMMKEWLMEDPRKDSECNEQDKEDNVRITNNVKCRQVQNEVNAVGGKIKDFDGVYQMDEKSAILYGKIEEEVYISWQWQETDSGYANSTITVKWPKPINGEVQLHALVDGKKIIVTESTVRRELQLEDVKGGYKTNLNWGKVQQCPTDPHHTPHYFWNHPLNLKERLKNLGILQEKDTQFGEGCKATPNESSSLRTTLGGGPRRKETTGIAIPQD
ncbi:probable RNA-dependent RNA polymerase 3 isoform X1 [Tanacetum coccineum]